MDVESNNITNVNTVGYKYSRANFSDLLAQTKAIATAPQGSLGGKNAVQVGLGSTVSSMTRIFSQGSVQNSDKNTDVAIQGDGFFIISPDGGNTYKYTRAGDFKFDAGGNFVDNNGFIAQGWLRDGTTGKVDATAPITNINIAPGLTTPANPSSGVTLKANLNSGPIIESFSAAYTVPSGTPNSATNPGEGDAFDENGNAISSGNLGVMFNEVGEAFALQKDQGVWVSFLSSQTSSITVPASTGTNDELNISFTLDDGTLKNVSTNSATGLETSAENANRYISAINAQTGITGVEGSYNSVTGNIDLINSNGNVSASHNIRLTVNAGDNSGFSTSSTTTAFRYQYDPTGTSAIANVDKKFSTIADLRYAMEIQARSYNTTTPVTNTYTVGVAGDGTNDDLSIDINGTAIPVSLSGAVATETNAITFAALNFNDTLTIGGLTLTVTDVGGMTDVEVADAFDNLANGATVANPLGNLTKGTFSGALTGWSTDTGLLDNIATFTSSTAGVNVTDLIVGGTGSLALNTPSQGNTPRTQDENGVAYQNAINAAGITGLTAIYSSITKELQLTNTDAGAGVITVTTPGQSGLSTGTVAGLIHGDGDAILNESNIEITVNELGKLRITNPGGSDDGDYDMNLKITALSAAGITENTKFTRNMEALNAVLPVGSGGIAFSQSFNAATHSSSIDIFDSLGSKHTLRMEFRKTALDTATGSTWDMLVSVPPPATIDTIAPTWEKTGSVRFNNDGSLSTYSPPNISFSGNNGSAPNQQVNLSLGTANAFDGMTSFDSVSATSGISQDGFTGGDLVGIRIDQSGTLVGSFSNGRSFGLAQIAMAKFTNNEGLGTEGGNVYVQSANSGDPIIGTAATAGRGFIQSSALEASNVDLSRSLTELIIIQRGFQANGKTITTSDQLLQTLIGLKN